MMRGMLSSIHFCSIGLIISATESSKLRDAPGDAGGAAAGPGLATDGGAEEALTFEAARPAAKASSADVGTESPPARAVGAAGGLDGRSLSGGGATGSWANGLGATGVGSGFAAENGRENKVARGGSGTLMPPVGVAGAVGVALAAAAATGAGDDGAGAVGGTTAAGGVDAGSETGGMAAITTGAGLPDLAAGGGTEGVSTSVPILGLKRGIVGCGGAGEPAKSRSSIDAFNGLDFAASLAPVVNGVPPGGLSVGSMRAVGMKPPLEG